MVCVSVLSVDERSDVSGLYCAGDDEGLDERER
jgi:hypothetical protein